MPIYVNVDTPNLGFPYLNFLGGYQLKKHPVCMCIKANCFRELKMTKE